MEWNCSISMSKFICYVPNLTYNVFHKMFHNFQKIVSTRSPPTLLIFIIIYDHLFLWFAQTIPTWAINSPLLVDVAFSYLIWPLSANVNLFSMQSWDLFEKMLKSLAPLKFIHLHKIFQHEILIHLSQCMSLFLI